MVVIGQHLGKPVPLHALHRTTIGEAVPFIQPRFIQTQGRKKRGMALPEDSHSRVSQQGPHYSSSLLPRVWPGTATKRQEFRQDFFGGVEMARAHRLAERQHPLVPGVGGAKQSNPVKRVGKEASHADRFGMP